MGRSSGIGTMGIGIVIVLSGCRAFPATPLAEAAAAGDAPRLRALLAEGARPDEPDGGGWTPLQWAARHGRLEAIRALAEAGAQVDLADAGNGWTPLMHAIHKDQAAAVGALLAAGADVNARCSGCATALIMAAGYGQTGVVASLLDHGADPHARTSGGENALWAAAGGGALADVTDGPPLGTCFPDTIELLRSRAPDLKLPRGLKTRMLGWLARPQACASLVAALPEG